MKKIVKKKEALMMRSIILFFLCVTCHGVDNTARRLLHHTMNVDLDNYLKLNKIRYVPIVGAVTDTAYALYLHNQYKKLVDISVDNQIQWNDYVTHANLNILHYDSFKDNLFKLCIAWFGLTCSTAVIAAALYARDGSDHYVGAASIFAGFESFLRITAFSMVLYDRRKFAKNATLESPPFKSINIRDQNIHCADA